MEIGSGIAELSNDIHLGGFELSAESVVVAVPAANHGGFHLAVAASRLAGTPPAQPHTGTPL